MELVARVIGTQPTIEGGQKLRIDAYFARTDREVTERDLAAFEAWLRLQPETRARSMPHGFVFADQTPGTWPDKLAEALGKRRGPAKPGSIEEFDRAHEELERGGWIGADGVSVERGPSGEPPSRLPRRRSKSRHFAPPPNRPAGEASPWTSDPHEALARLGDGPPVRKAVGS